jgi:hypothetical protein
VADFLGKPLRHDALVASVRKLLKAAPGSSEVALMISNFRTIARNR